VHVAVLSVIIMNTETVLYSDFKVCALRIVHCKAEVIMLPEPLTWRWKCIQFPEGCVCFSLWDMDKARHQPVPSVTCRH